ncbi:MAG TPA: thiolase family protein [Candidatus Polarisedimenticolia bacterium]|nr:thiolase family protein [Candidatus Polarisedimenticolia bacterium]
MPALVVAGARTPFAKAGADLRRVSARELGVAAVREAVARSGFLPSEIDAVVMGNVASPADASNVARVIAVQAGLPEAVPAHTVNRNCASGMEAVAEAAEMIGSGRARVVVAGGVESMSNVPFLVTEELKDILTAAARARSFPARLRAWMRLRPRAFKPIPGLLAGLTDPLCGLSMGQTAEVLALEFGIGREEQDRFALESHRRAVAAADRLREEMTPVFLPPRWDKALHDDVGPRRQQTMEALARLKPHFDRERGTVTAGNSSPITDGAAAVVMASADAVRDRSLRPLASVRSWAAAGLSPRRMGLGPAFAAPLALARGGARLADVGLIEINEAFAAQVLACVAALASDRFAREELGLERAVGEIDPDRANVNGGAIALGHPVGASGARLVLTLAMEMRRRGAGLGLATLCIGGGQGMAVLLEAA